MENLDMTTRAIFGEKQVDENRSSQETEAIASTNKTGTEQRQRAVAPLAPARHSKRGTWLSVGWRALSVFPLAALAVACAGLLGEPAAGGESSFLRACSSECGGGFECISNVCTKGCVVAKDTCENANPKAVCTNASIEAGNVAVCDVACTGDSECSSLGTGFRCDTGFCRGKSLQTSIGQGGGSGTSAPKAQAGFGGAITSLGGGTATLGTGNPASAGTAAFTPSGGTAGTALPGASCRVAYREYPSGTTGIPIADGSSCGTCSCVDGSLQCAKNDECPLGSPIVACPTSVQTDPVMAETLGFIAGDSLTLNVSYGGGCSTHDFALCYESYFGDSEPPAAILRLIHDGHGDSCEAMKSTALRFDLTPLAQYYKQSNASAGGLLSTPYGLYVFGHAACDELSRAATDQLSRSISATLKTCSSTFDCQLVDTSTACSGACGAVVSRNTPVSPVSPGSVLSAAELSARVDQVNAGQCGKMAEYQCPVSLVDCAAIAMDCVNGNCVAVPQ